MFEKLCLDGDTQQGSYHIENGKMNVFYPGRSPTVELASLENTVDDLLALGIPRYVRELIFSPRYYVEGEKGQVFKFKDTCTDCAV